LSHILSIFILLFLGACTSTPHHAPLKNTYWSLVELNNEESYNTPYQPEVHLIFHVNDASVHGSDGCNSLKASYTQNKETFTFSKIISTRMFCQEGSEQAALFNEALKKTDSLYIYGNELFLYHNQQQIARFEAKEDY